jgi:hypothetical protein
MTCGLVLVEVMFRIHILHLVRLSAEEFDFRFCVNVCSWR